MDLRAMFGNEGYANGKAAVVELREPETFGVPAKEVLRRNSPRLLAQAAEMAVTFLVDT